MNHGYCGKKTQLPQFEIKRPALIGTHSNNLSIALNSTTYCWVVDAPHVFNLWHHWVCLKHDKLKEPVSILADFLIYNSSIRFVDLLRLKSEIYPIISCVFRRGSDGFMPFKGWRELVRSWGKQSPLVFELGIHPIFNNLEQ